MATSANSATVRLRRVWFQVHKWIGLILAPLVIVICLTGSVLVWDEWVGEALNPQRQAHAEASQPAQFYAEAARKALQPGETLLSLTYPDDGQGAVMAMASQAGQPRGGRPVRTQLWLDPVDGHELDRADTGSGILQVMHVLHGSLLIPGMGRSIVGWIGVLMLISSLTGLWLWWPFKGGFVRGLRWKRMPTTSGNLHHQGGFWIMIPLAVLSFTGAWISFPPFFAQFSGDPSGPPPGFFQRLNAKPVELVEMTPDQALAMLQPLAAGELRAIAWPTSPDAQWSITFEGADGPAVFKVADADGRISPPEPAPPETTARLMRRIHDGTDTGIVWQVIVFLGGLLPSVLAVTGVLMWLRGRKVKGSVRAAFAAERDGN